MSASRPNESKMGSTKFWNGRVCVLILGVSVVTLFAAARSEAADTPKRPDIVIILADDLGYGDVSCFNPNGKIATPNFDRMAADGLMLTDSHSPASWCTPTRYSLLTGSYPFRCVSLRDKQPVIRDDEPTLPGFLKKHGYTTTMVGKWHLGFEGGHDIGDQEHIGGPVDRGFDSYYGIPRSLDIPPYYWIEDRKAVAPPTETVAANNSEGWSPIQGAFWREGKVAPGFEFDQVTPIVEHRAATFIEKQGPQRNRDPYFLYVALPSPHTPWVPTKEFDGTSDVALYGDFVVQVDAVVGRISAAIESIGGTKNTLVIITSDNGACWYAEDDERTGHDASGGYRGMKGDAHEGGHRVPTIVRWPAKTPAGMSSHALTCHADFFATIAEFIDAPLPAEGAFDSFSMASCWTKASDQGPRKTFLEQASRQNLLSIREGQWKLIPTLGSAGFTKPSKISPGVGDPEGQLYNLAEDPAESNNLYGERSDIVARLMGEMSELRSGSRTRP